MNHELCWNVQRHLLGSSSCSRNSFCISSSDGDCVAWSWTGSFLCDPNISTIFFFLRRSQWLVIGAQVNDCLLLSHFIKLTWRPTWTAMFVHRARGLSVGLHLLGILEVQSCQKTLTVGTHNVSFITTERTQKWIQPKLVLCLWFLWPPESPLYEETPLFCIYLFLFTVRWRWIDHL